MQFDMGDVPAWAALLASAGAIVVAVRANRHAKGSAAQARRSADAAERQAQAAEAALPPPPPSVAWRIEWAGGSRYVLRNVGVGTATGVRVVEDAAVLWDLDDQSSITIRPNGSISFLTAPSLVDPAPDELMVSWDGQSEAVAVPIP